MGRPVRRNTADHAQIAFRLAAQPYVWGTVSTYPAAYVAANAAWQIETARDTFRVYGPAGYFETRTTPVEDGTLLEARYIGRGSKPRRRPDTEPTDTDAVWADALTALTPDTAPNGAS